MPGTREVQFSSIQPGEVQIWTASVDRLHHELSLIDFKRVLSEAEMRMAMEISNQEVRKEYLATRYFIRILLSNYSHSVEPRAWQFSENQYGKPSVDCKVAGWPLEFNISHSKGIILCAFCLGLPVGADIESRSRKVEWLEMAGESFSAKEARELGKLPLQNIPERFFEYWTLKEAFIKAMGMGLSLPLGDFSFHLQPDKRIGIEFSSRIAEDPVNWQFRLFEVTPGYQCALAVKCGAGKDISLTMMDSAFIFRPYVSAA